MGDYSVSAAPIARIPFVGTVIAPSPSIRIRPWGAFHLAWFLQESSVQALGRAVDRAYRPDLNDARAVPGHGPHPERACFDFILLEDSSYVGESFGGST
jgi:hypothetical protein